MADRKDLSKFKGNPITLTGQGACKVGDKAPSFTAIAQDLSDKSLKDYAGKVVVISSVPSLDTGICDKQTRAFNEKAGGLGDDVVVLTISRDLPFAQKRWCGAAGVDRVVTLSDFRDHAFGRSYGLEIGDSPLKGLLARSVIVVDKTGTVKYQEIVPEIAQEPDYDKALAAVNAAR